MDKKIITIAIDTSCDETSASVVEGFTVLSNVMPSQIEFHKKYGGVVPSIAKLAHQDRIDGVVTEALKRARKTIEEIDFIAVTYGPGLAIALEVGIKKAKELSEKYNKPLIAVNHMEGHMLSAFAERKKITPSSLRDTPSLAKREIPTLSGEGVIFPALGFLVSGGHTELILIKDWCDYEKIGETLDDSCGEAYDKCGRMLGLGYPAGPVISEFAKLHRKNMTMRIVKKSQSTVIETQNVDTKQTYELPIGMAHSNDLNFSYSGLKTAFKQLIEHLIGAADLLPPQNNYSNLSKIQIYDLCVTFEYAALKQLEVKLAKAIEIYEPKEVWLGGGVVASARLRERMRAVGAAHEPHLGVRHPYSNKLTGDNAAMIGVAANVRVKKLGGKEKILDNLNDNAEAFENKGIFLKNLEKIDREPNLSF